VDKFLTAFIPPIVAEALFADANKLLEIGLKV